MYLNSPMVTWLNWFANFIMDSLLREVFDFLKGCMGEALVKGVANFINVFFVKGVSKFINGYMGDVLVNGVLNFINGFFIKRGF